MVKRKNTKRTKVLANGQTAVYLNLWIWQNQDEVLLKLKAKGVHTTKAAIVREALAFYFNSLRQDGVKI